MSRVGVPGHRSRPRSSPHDALVSDLKQVVSDIQLFIQMASDVYHENAALLDSLPSAKEYNTALLGLSYDLSLLSTTLEHPTSLDTTHSSDSDIGGLRPGASEPRLGNLLTSFRESRSSLQARSRLFQNASHDNLSQLAPAIDLLSKTGIEDIRAMRTQIHAFYDDVRDCGPAFPQHRDVSKVLRRDFHRCPFALPAEELDEYHIDVDLDAHTISYNREWLSRNIRAFQHTGRLWIKHNTIESTVECIGRSRATLLGLVQSLLESNQAAFRRVEEDGTQTLSDHYERAITSIRREVQRDQEQKFCVAFCGMVKAGKSLFINALIGCLVLPSDELPSTAWPCRLRHVKGETEPHLQVNPDVFMEAIEQLRDKKYGEQMRRIAPTADDSNDPFSGVFSDIDFESDASAGDSGQKAYPMTEEQRRFYLRWIDLHPVTKENLILFERDDFRMCSTAYGTEQVSSLLAQVNDVIRLCTRFQLPVPAVAPHNWPVVELEFQALKDKDLTNQIELIDLPGIGEASIGSDDINVYEDLVRTVAREANTVIPIISFKEISKKDWRSKLPKIIENGLGRAPEMALCTHLDQIVKSLKEQQIKSVAREFWQLTAGARELLTISMNGKPPFEDISQRPDDPVGECAEKILGTGDTSEKYESLIHQEWVEAVHDQLQESGLEHAVTRLTTDIVAKEQSFSLIMEGRKIRQMLSKLLEEQKRNLSGMTRTTDEFERAFQDFKVTKSRIKDVLERWGEEEKTMRVSAERQRQQALKVFEREALKLGSEAMFAITRKTEWEPRIKQLDDGKLQFSRKAEVEYFLLIVQEEMRKSLCTLKAQFVQAMRRLADQIRRELFRKLKASIEGLPGADAGDKEAINTVVETLEHYGESLDVLLLSKLGKKVLQVVVAARHNARSAYGAIQVAIAGALLPQRQGAHDQVDQAPSSIAASSDADSSEKGIDLNSLGFMLRAPVAVLAFIPWVFGAGIWPFLAKSRYYILDQAAVLNEIATKAIRPYVDRLGEESMRTLEDMEAASSLLAKSAVEKALQEEEQSFEREQRTWMYASDEQFLHTNATNAMSLLLNLACGEAALANILERLEAIRA